MGTVTARLSISSADVLSAPIALSLASSLNVDSGFIKKVKVSATSVGANGEVIYKNGDKSGSAYLYVRNLQTNDTDLVTIYESTNNDTVIKLRGGEFAFLPVDVTATFQASVSTADDMIEYGVFGTDSSAVRYI